MTTRRAPLFDVLTARGGEPPAPARSPAAGDGQVRESVRRELGLLFNSTPLKSSESLAQLTHVASSTLGYGLPALAGRAASSVDQRWLAAQLTQAIRRFEPRLLPESVRVRARARHTVSHNVLSFEIDACVQHAYGTETIELDSELDLESGVARVLERPRQRSPEEAEARG